MKLVLILLIAYTGFASAGGYGRNEQMDELDEMATTIMQHLQKDHIPSDDSSSGAHNAPIHHILKGNFGKQVMENGFNKTDKIKVTVGVKGIRFVSVEQNGTFVNISSVFGVGAAAVYNIVQEDSDDRDDNVSFEEIDRLIEPLRDQYIDQTKAKKDEIKVILGQSAKFGLKVKQNEKDVSVKVKHGYIVGAKTNITKGIHTQHDPQ